MYFCLKVPIMSLFVLGYRRVMVNLWERPAHKDVTVIQAGLMGATHKSV